MIRDGGGDGGGGGCEKCHYHQVGSLGLDNPWETTESLDQCISQLVAIGRCVNHSNLRGTQPQAFVLPRVSSGWLGQLCRSPLGLAPACRFQPGLLSSVWNEQAARGIALSRWRQNGSICISKSQHPSQGAEIFPPCLVGRTAKSHGESSGCGEA